MLEKDKYMISLICGIKKKKTNVTNELIYKTETDQENKLMVTKWESGGRERMDGESGWVDANDYT